MKFKDNKFIMNKNAIYITKARKRKLKPYNSFKSENQGEVNVGNIQD